MKYSYFISFSYFDYDRQTPKIITQTTIVTLDFKLLNNQDFKSLEKLIKENNFTREELVIQNISFLHAFVDD